MASPPTTERERQRSEVSFQFGKLVVKYHPFLLLSVIKLVLMYRVVRKKFSLFENSRPKCGQAKWLANVQPNETICGSILST